MCGCATKQPETIARAANQQPGDVTLRVEDMTCGHCAGTITKAIETRLPGTQVQADPATKLVSIRGSADLTSIKEIVAAAGYTPS